MNSGLFAGAIALPFLAFLATHCMHILINANRILTRRLGVGMLEYQEVSRHCFFSFVEQSVSHWGLFA